MAKLNQILAVVSGKKTRTSRALTDIHHKIQKPNLLEGMSRTYRPKDENGDKLPPENKCVQVKIPEVLTEVSDIMTELFDVVATQDWANCIAEADVVVDGETIVSSVPVTYLLFLEKQLTDIHTFITKIPTLDPGERWEYDGNVDCWATPPHNTVRTKKVPRNHVVTEATKEHPAQVQVYTEDEVVGEWSLVKFSGALPAQQKNEMLTRVRILQEAVKFAREEANSIAVNNQKVGRKIFEYLFGNHAS